MHVCDKKVEEGVAGKEGTREGKEGKGKTIFCLMPHIHTNIHMHAHIHSCVHVCTHSCVHIHTHAYTHMCTLTHTYIHTHAHMRAHTHTHTMKAEQLLKRKREKGGKTRRHGEGMKVSKVQK